LNGVNALAAIALVAVNAVCLVGLFAIQLRRIRRGQFLASLTCLAIFASVTQASHNTWTKWTFEPGTPGNPPAGIGQNMNNISPAIGSGVATGRHNNAFTVWDNPFGNGSQESLNSNNWDIGDYYQFRTSSLSARNLDLSWSQTRSSTGPSEFSLRYSTDGVNFTPHMSYTVPEIDWSNVVPNPASNFSADLGSITALNNQANVYFRLVATNAPGSPGGINRVDDFTVTIPEPATGLLALVCLGALGLVRRRSWLGVS
jgi:hypothetical protein